MAVDPLPYIPAIGTPQCCGCVLAMGEMKSETRGWHHANPAAGNKPKQNRAGRLAGTNDTHIHAPRGKCRPARIILSDRSTVIVIDVDRLGFRERTGEHERDNYGEQESYATEAAPAPVGNQFRNDSSAEDYAIASKIMIRVISVPLRPQPHDLPPAANGIQPRRERRPWWRRVVSSLPETDSIERSLFRIIATL
jgi:hypothetical protein